jgi:Kef-type K+ transport system membrane component KefB
MIESVLLILLLTVFFAKLVGSFFDRIGLDSSVGELLTGIVLGTSMLKLVSAESIEPFAIMGSVLILFIAGIKEENVDEIYKDKKALHLGLLLLVVNTVMMSVLFYFVPPFFGITFNLFQAIVMGIAFGIIDIGVPAKVLISKGMIKSPEGKITIRAAILNIFIGLVLFTFVTVIMNADFMGMLLKIIQVLGFLVLTYILMLTLTKITPFFMKLHIEEAELSLALILILALAYITELLGLSNVLGAFIAGVLVARLPFAETKSFTDKIKSISFGIFIPLFFVWFGLTINLEEIFKNLLLAGIIFISYTALRFITTYIYLKKQNLAMPALISSSMLSVDVESLVILIIAIRAGIFTSDIPLTLFAPSVFLSTVLIVVLVAVFSKKQASEISSMADKKN